jgi:hypothetical protein
VGQCGHHLGNADQYRLARDAQYRHMVGLRAAITTLGKRLAAPTTDTLTVAQRKARRAAKAVKGCRLAGMADPAGIQLFAVNPPDSSVCVCVCVGGGGGHENWRNP